MATFRGSIATGGLLAVMLLTACARTNTETSTSVLTEESGLASLRTVGGESAPLDEVIAHHELTVLIWWGSTCPCVERYQSRMEALRQRYDAKQVAMLAIDSNADDSPEVIERVTRERGFTLPVYLDPGARLATRLGVRSTPTVVLVDRQGNRRFVGWIDNEREEGRRGREAYLEQAIDAGLRGEAGPERSPVYGCSITRRLGDTGGCAVVER